jgi:hypothetical protein
MKLCSCGKQLKDSNSTGQCKTCYKRDYNKKWNDAHKQERKLVAQVYYQTYKNELDAEAKLRNAARKEEIRAYSKLYYQEHKDEVLAKAKVYKLEKFKTDINFRLKANLRSRLCAAVKNNQKGGSAVRDLGCSIEELKKHLESQFEPGMTWDNWSQDGWHIDHIKPLASFDLSDRAQFLEACRYTNLQPLWAEDNHKKSDKNGTRID